MPVRPVSSCPPPRPSNVATPVAGTHRPYASVSHRLCPLTSSLFSSAWFQCVMHTPHVLSSKANLVSFRICMMKWGNSNWLYFMAECFEERDNACITIFAALLFLSTLTVSVLCSLAHIRCKHFISTLLYCITIRMVHDFSSVYFSWSVCVFSWQYLHEKNTTWLYWYICPGLVAYRCSIIALRAWAV